jgi:hypothetical protein
VHDLVLAKRLEMLAGDVSPLVTKDSLADVLEPNYSRPIRYVVRCLQVRAEGSVG